MPTTIPPTLAAITAPTPVANPSNRGPGAQCGTPFSRHLEQLREIRAQEARQSAAPHKPAPAAEPPARAEGQRPPTPAASTRVDAARVARAPAPRRTQAAADPASGADPQTEKEPRATTDATDPGTDELPAALALVPNAATPAAELPAATPATAAALLAPPAAPATPATAAAAAGPALAAPDPALQARATGSLVTGLPAAPQGPAPARLDEREPAARTRPEAAASPWQQAQAAALLADHLQAPTLRSPASEAGPAAPHDLTAAATTISGAGNSVMHPTPTVESANLSLATPVTSSEFRAALGVQVSLLARAGVQQAELHLNPAEMGPVSIQIVLDGQQAQINFGADSALTRQVIEAGMPELASALRDAGLTLTGGGVSQHAGGQRQDPNANPAAAGQGGTAGSGPPPEDPGTEVRRSALRAAQGGVDLYA